MITLANWFVHSRVPKAVNICTTALSFPRSAVGLSVVVSFPGHTHLLSFVVAVVAVFFFCLFFFGGVGVVVVGFVVG